MFTRSYKFKISLFVCMLAAILTVVFSVFTFMNRQNNNISAAYTQALNSSTSTSSIIDEKLKTIKQYYLGRGTDSKVSWFLKNSLDYSSYSNISELISEMEAKALFGDFVKKYTLVNFNKAWVLSSKGMFPLQDSKSIDVLRELYNSDMVINGWYYDSTGTHIDMLDRDYKHTTETAGLNLVINLPVITKNHNGMLLVNIGESVLNNWIRSSSKDMGKMYVIDRTGNIIYGQEDEFSKECLNISFYNTTKEPILKTINDKKYVVAASSSDIIDWNYYTFISISDGTYSADSMFIPVILLTIIVTFLVFLIFTKVIYKPVEKLVQSVSDSEGKIKGNELDYVQKQFESLKNDKAHMTTVMNQNHDKLLELFELRLIRGEVRSVDEWEEYTKNLNITVPKLFCSTVMVIDLTDEEFLNNNVSEDAICLSIIENLPDNLKAMLWMPLVYNSCTLFTLLAGDSEEALNDKTSQFYVDMQKFVEDTTGYHIIMGVSATHTDKKHIRAAYRESVNALTMTSENTEDERLHYYLNSVVTHDDKYNDSFEHDIQQAINNMDKEQCYKIINEFYEYIRSGISFELASIYIKRMIDSILIACVNAKLDTESIFPEGGIDKIYATIQGTGDYGAVRRNLKAMLIDPILEARRCMLENDSFSVMEQIEKMLYDSHGNVSLNECADAMGVSTTYIWKVLKMERGKTFSEYQEEIKIEEAKRLLLNTSMSVADIAAELNYTNAQNFIRFFSKGTGLTPGKFRKLY